MFFTKDDFAIIVTCFAKERMDWYSEYARLLHLGHIARTCWWRKAWTVCKPQRSSECYQRQMAWCWSSDNEGSYFAVEKVFSSSSKAECWTYSVHFLLITWLMITAYERRHEWWTSCKHCFMSFDINTMSFVSLLIQKCLGENLYTYSEMFANCIYAFHLIYFDYSVA